MHRLAASSLTTCGPKILVAKSANRVSNRTGSLARVPKKTDYGLCQPETLRIETANRERSPRLDLRVTFPSTLPFYLPCLCFQILFPLSSRFLFGWLGFSLDVTSRSFLLSISRLLQRPCAFFSSFFLRCFPFLLSILRLLQSRLSLVSSFLFSFFSCLYSERTPFFNSFYLCLEVDLHAFHAFPCFISPAFTRKSVAALFHHSLSLLFSRWILRGFSLCMFWFDASVTLVVCQGIGADFFELFLALLYSIGSSPLIPSSVCLLTLH